MKKRKLGLTTQIFIIACLLLLSANVILGVILISQSRAAMKSSLNQNMLEVAKTAAAFLDGDALGSFTADDVGSSPAYLAAYDTLSVIQERFGIEYVYTVRYDEGYQTFVFTIDPDPVDPALFGEVMESPTEALFSANRGVAAVDTVPMKDRWGCFYSAYCPVRDSAGNITGVVGVDFDVQWYRSQVRAQTLSIIISSSISLAVGFLILLLALSRTRKKFHLLYNELSSLSSDVEKMTEEIISTPDYEETDHETESGDASLPEASSSEESIEMFGGKIRSTQAKLRAYIAHVHEQAYTDIMTGFGNKTAYLDLVKVLNRRIEVDNASFSIAVFDINGLKRINDNYGHEYGDMIIVDSASAIRKIFGEAHLFRIGGDEFIAVLEEASEEKLSSLFRALDQEVSRFNAEDKQYEMTLSFSKGFAVYKPELDDEFKSVFKRADEEMYRDKWLYYSRVGDRRKHRNPPQDIPAERQ